MNDLLLGEKFSKEVVQGILRLSKLKDECGGQPEAWGWDLRADVRRRETRHVSWGVAAACSWGSLSHGPAAALTPGSASS